MNKQHCNAIQQSFYYQYDTSLGKYVCQKFTILLRDTSENGANLWFLNLIRSANHWVHEANSQTRARVTYVCLLAASHDTGKHVNFMFVFCIRFTFHPSIHVCIIKIHYTGRTTSITTTTTRTTSLNATSMPDASTSSPAPASSRSTTSLSEPGFLQYYLELAPYSCLTCRCWTSF